MWSVFLVISTSLSCVSATLTSPKDGPDSSLQLRSSPAFHEPILGVANKVNHVPVRRSGTAPHNNQALRSVLGLDQDHIGRRHKDGESPATVRLTGQSYVADVTLGGQNIPLLIDTGSADLWVAPDSFVCLDEKHEEASKETCNIPVYFQGTFSGEVVKDQYFSISYGNEQYAYGEYGYESVTFGGITVPNQQIALPSTGYFYAASGDFSGIFGLGFPSVTAARSGGTPTEYKGNDDPSGSYDPWFTSAVKQNLTHPVFSFALDLIGGGVLAIGGAADVPITGEYVSTPILKLDLDQDGRGAKEFTYYTIMVEDFLIAGESFSRLSAAADADAEPSAEPRSDSDSDSDSDSAKAQGLPVVVDTGYPDNILPPSVIKALYAAFETPPQIIDLDGAALYAAPCDADVPSFGIQIAGRVLEQSTSQVLVAGANTTVNGTAYCVLGAQPGIQDVGLLGMPFLSGVVAVFDVGAAEMRFAQREGVGGSGHGNATSGTGPAGQTGSMDIPPASSGLADTNAGDRLLPLWGFKF